MRVLQQMLKPIEVCEDISFDQGETTVFGPGWETRKKHELTWGSSGGHLGVIWVSHTWEDWVGSGWSWKLMNYGVWLFQRL